MNLIARFAEIRQFLNERHDPEASKVEFSHVVRIWEDLEVTITKCGSLLDQRNEHIIESSSLDIPLPVELFPCRLGTHGYIFLAYGDHEDTLKALKELINGGTV